MFFRAQNLGPIRDAEIDLSKDLVVLAGPNNSGKTYIAWSVYGLHRSRPALNVVLDRWVRQLLESPEHAIDLGDLFAQGEGALLESIATEYKSKLHLCFAAESTYFSAVNVSLRDVDLLKRSGPIAHISGLAATLGISALRTHGPGSTRIGWTILVDDHFKTFFNAMKEGAPTPAELQAATTSALTTLATEHRKSLEGDLSSGLQSLVYSVLFPHCTIFPAERIAVNIFAKELALKRTELVDELVDADLDDQSSAPLELVRRKAGRYPWPIRDSLKTANDLANLSKEKGPFAALADELESAVLGGEIAVSEAGEMLFSLRGETDRRLQMHLTASVVKSLSSLVFYFRYLARRGDFIIVDEPELNLHPDNQRKLTRILAKAVGLGFKVMISTHSDFVLRELNHLIMLSKLPEGEAQALGYDPRFALDPKRLGVYLFNEQHAYPVPVEETGFSIKTIDDVVSQLNADEQRLYARLSD
ncbi:AAA family ATPase [Sorangium sp. So ce1153]|uniref:AAA family ATPase n=1 Tax=Sorangium sp. So ce1153 TaxID=3133333 RepID=UPI003F60F6A2